MRKAFAVLGPVRVPLLGACLLLALPGLAFVPGTPSGLLRGLFDLAPLTPDGGVVEFTGRTAITCFFAWLAYGLAAIAVFQSAGIILDFAPERLGIAPPFAGRWLASQAVVPVAALCAPALVASWAVSLDRCARVGPMLAGAAVALAAVVLLLLALRRRTRRPPPFADRLRRDVERSLERVGPRGYLRDPADVARADPFVHHAWAAFFVSVSATFWLFVLLWARWPSLQVWFRVPAICSALLLVMLAVWTLSALTFFLDAYRVPVLSLLVIVAAVAGFRDHRFAPRAPRVPSAALLPGEVLARHGSPSRIVVVAAAGGGIQAAGWTARVLRGLVEATPPASLDALLASLVVVSGVSGGSVGLAPFLAAVLDGGTPGRALGRPLLLDALGAAADSSLDAVAASFATSDLIPLWPLPDRGAALEASWRRAWRGAGIRDDVGLAALAEGTLAGRVPAVMFNATNMTTGERLVIGTTVPYVAPGAVPAGYVHAARVRASGKRDGTLVVDYDPRPLVADLDLAVAARLSATFPFVTPAAHCAACPRGAAEYVVDGGYIDNYGTESLVEWLEPLLRDTSVTVDVVQIVSFPEGATIASAPRRPLLPQSQLAAPIEAVLNVRAPAQGRRGARDVDELASRFPGRVCSRRFVYEGCDHRVASAPPLSWHLTAGQKRELEDAWSGCPAAPAGARDVSYAARARAVVEHALGLGDGECATIEPTVPPRGATR